MIAELYLLLVFAFYGENVSMARASVYVTLEECVEAAGESGFRHLPKNPSDGVYFACVRSSDPYL
jgi:hypothetical protein